ncbi:MAG TPA: hypothetical protein PLO23_00475 [Alphaproteobacteria bacterium]|nr:hypothetical protein [Alphaproteobacteria bacterium]
MKLLSTLLALMLLAGTVQAAEPFTYAPEHCDFQVSFPEKPHTSRLCEADNKDRCYDLVSFTRTYEVAATVNVRVICNPVAEGVKDRYTEEVAKAAVKAMAEKNNLTEYRTSFRSEAAVNQAGLVGEGLVGNDPKIYIAQLWVGEKSVMSVEAEIIGQAFEDADKLFAETLKSVKLKSGIGNQGSEEKEKRDSEKPKAAESETEKTSDP